VRLVAKRDVMDAQDANAVSGIVENALASFETLKVY
jgi:hypothetical protein